MTTVAILTFISMIKFESRKRSFSLQNFSFKISWHIMLRWVEPDISFIILIRGSRKFCQRGSNSDNSFAVDDGRENPNYISIKEGHHRPASETPFWWPNIECWLGSFWHFRGYGQVLLRNPIALWIFRGEVVWTPCAPSRSAHGQLFYVSHILIQIHAGLNN